MKNSILFITLLFFGISFNATAQDRHDQSERSKKKAEMKALLDVHRAEVKDIKNNSSLSEEQKETLILEKKTALKSKLAETKGLKHLRGPHGKKGIRHAERMAIKEKLDEIKNDPNLTEEEKAAARDAYFSETAYKYREGKFPRDRKRMAAKQRRKMKKEFSEMSEEERKALKDDLKEHKKDRENHRQWAKDKRAKQGQDRPIVQKRKLTEAQKKQALERITKREKYLDKQLKKGKLSLEEYDRQSQRISRVKGRLESIEK